MNLNDYQTFARKTAVFDGGKGLGEKILYCALSLAGEAGETANAIKKVFRPIGAGELGYKLSSYAFSAGETDFEARDKVAEELGDTLWYLAMLADLMGFDLDEIAQRNLAKLAERYGK